MIGSSDSNLSTLIVVVLLEVIVAIVVTVVEEPERLSSRLPKQVQVERDLLVEAT